MVLRVRVPDVDAGGARATSCSSEESSWRQSPVAPGCGVALLPAAARSFRDRTPRPCRRTCSRGRTPDRATAPTRHRPTRSSRPCPTSRSRSPKPAPGAPASAAAYADCKLAVNPEGCQVRIRRYENQSRCEASARPWCCGAPSSAPLGAQTPAGARRKARPPRARSGPPGDDNAAETRARLQEILRQHPPSLSDGAPARPVAPDDGVVPRAVSGPRGVSGPAPRDRQEPQLLSRPSDIRLRPRRVAGALPLAHRRRHDYR